MATTAATPSTATIPGAPRTPNAVNRSAEIINETASSLRAAGLNCPTRPTRYPPTAHRRKPVNVIAIAATIAARTFPVKCMYTAAVATSRASIDRKTHLMGMSRSVLSSRLDDVSRAS